MATHPTRSDGAYAALAEHYDAFTHHPLYAGWVRRLERLARSHGLRGTRVLDVGCGTGKSLIPLAEAGYRCAGCDPSAEMLARARTKLGSRVTLTRAGLPDLPVLGAFDYISCLNDVINYVPRQQLAAAVESLAANLVAGGTLVFDASTIALYRSFFARVEWRESNGCVFIWRGGAVHDFEPGATAHATIEVLTRRGPLWQRGTIHDAQHHHPEAELVRALADAGLHVEAVYGQDDEGLPELPLNPLRHTKALYVATKPVGTRDTKGGNGDAEDHEAPRARDPGPGVREERLENGGGPAAQARPDLAATAGVRRP